MHSLCLLKPYKKKVIFGKSYITRSDAMRVLGYAKKDINILLEKGRLKWAQEKPNGKILIEVHSLLKLQNEKTK